MKTLLAIGDYKDWDSYLKFYRQKRLFKKHGFIFKGVSYNSLLKKNLPEIKTKKVIVFLFFPFEYWDNNIETKKDKAVYGNKSYYLKFDAFWRKVKKIVKDAYSDKKVYFVNNPTQLALDRDKELTKRILSKAKVSVCRAYLTRDYKKVIGLLDKGKKFFIKVRFGSMGKGISYLEKGKCITNFRFRNKKIISKKSDYGWSFKEVKDKESFLKQLLKQDIIIEEAIDPFVLKKRKFDLRLYVFFEKVIYIYPRSNDYNKITTNISQGAKGEAQRFLKSIPKDILKRSEKEAVKAMKAMKLNFAGVDIMPSADGKVKVIEVNTFPGFPKMKSYNISRFMINILGKQKWR